mmetsp:Transcript_28785/g.61228  ORF Transcript_28785/g.61228 Transcript_28785/m.61228 type:complete len:968 (-) Transcript_28785:263-3166(-)
MACAPRGPACVQDPRAIARYGQMLPNQMPPSRNPQGPQFPGMPGPCRGPTVPAATPVTSMEGLRPAHSSFVVVGIGHQPPPMRPAPHGVNGGPRPRPAGPGSVYLHDQPRPIGCPNLQHQVPHAPHPPPHHLPQQQPPQPRPPGPMPQSGTVPSGPQQSPPGTRPPNGPIIARPWMAPNPAATPFPPGQPMIPSHSLPNTQNPCPPPQHQQQPQYLQQQQQQQQKQHLHPVGWQQQQQPPASQPQHSPGTSPPRVREQQLSSQSQEQPQQGQHPAASTQAPPKQQRQPPQGARRPLMQSASWQMGTQNSSTMQHGPNRQALSLLPTHKEHDPSLPGLPARSKSFSDISGQVNCYQTSNQQQPLHQQQHHQPFPQRPPATSPPHQHQQPQNQWFPPQSIPEHHQQHPHPRPPPPFEQVRQQSHRANAPAPLQSFSLTRPPAELPEELRREYQVEGGLIGEGAFAVVRRLRHRETGRLLALKVVEKYPLRERNMIHQLHREVRIQKRVQHRYILHLLGSHECDMYMYLILEHCGGGTLRALCMQQPQCRLPEAASGRYFAQILQGVACLHQHDCVHRDLKPENMLLTDRDEVRICDFGWSAEVQREQALRTTCGTPQYWPPEIYEMADQGVGVDLWALGILVFELLVGHAPFWGTREELRAKVLNVHLAWPERLFSPEAAGVFQSLLKRNPSERASAATLLERDPWVRQALQALEEGNPSPVHRRVSGGVDVAVEVHSRSVASPERAETQSPNKSLAGVEVEVVVTSATSSPKSSAAAPPRNVHHGGMGYYGLPPPTNSPTAVVAATGGMLPSTAAPAVPAAVASPAIFATAVASGHFAIAPSGGGCCCCMGAGGPCHGAGAGGGAGFALASSPVPSTGPGAGSLGALGACACSSSRCNLGPPSPVCVEVVSRSSGPCSTPPPPRSPFGNVECVEATIPLQPRLVAVSGGQVQLHAAPPVLKSPRRSPR